MKLLVVTEKASDFTELLSTCDVEMEQLTQQEAITVDLAVYDAYCILEPGVVLDAGFRQRMEEENAKGKKVFTEAIGSFLDIYCAPAVNTVHHRLIYMEPEEGEGITGLTTGDLLDDQSNWIYEPRDMMKDSVQLLLYQYHIVAHSHTDMPREEIREKSLPGLWLCQKGTVLMSSFLLHNFNKARFAPRQSWIKVISFIVEWLTGNIPGRFPESIVRHELNVDLTDQSIFEAYRKRAIEKGLHWLEGYLVDQGRGGIQEGLWHNIDPEGEQRPFINIRADCSGESAGAFGMYAYLTGNDKYAQIAGHLEQFIYGPMVEKGGIFDGMMRWSAEAWGVCYQDDVARAILPTLFKCIFLKQDAYFPTVSRVLDFLLRTTAKDGTRVSRTDRIKLDEQAIIALAEAREGCHKAHHNAYYHAALLLAYEYGGDERYLEMAKRGLETLMSLYPDTVREQSETEEVCRLILPLSVLYHISGEEKHKEMLYRVTSDLERFRHPFGGYVEWDTGYKASYSRVSTDECSLLTHNGDPVADQLYSCNWLPVGFAYAYYATGDERFQELWSNIVRYFIRTQIHSNYKRIDGAWSRAFDMDIQEIYGAPHDSGWAVNVCETGWSCTEILMGMMLPDFIERSKE